MLKRKFLKGNHNSPFYTLHSTLSRKRDYFTFSKYLSMSHAFCSGMVM